MSAPLDFDLDELMSPEPAPAKPLLRPADRVPLRPVEPGQPRSASGLPETAVPPAPRIPSANRPTSAPAPSRPVAPSPAGIPNPALTAEEWGRRAEKAYSRGQFDESIAACRAALRLSPFSVQYRELMAECLYEKIQPSRRAAKAPIAEPRASRPAAPTAPVAPSPSSARPEESARPRVKVRPELLPAARRGSVPALPWWTIGIGVAVTVIGLSLAGAGAVAFRNWLETREAAVATRSAEAALPEALAALMEGAGEDIAKGNPGRALAGLRNALVDHPRHRVVIEERLTAALLAEGTRLSKRREHAAALKTLREASTLSPADPAVWVAIGDASLQQGRATRDRTQQRRLYADAEQGFRKALERDAASPPALLGLAQVYSATNERQKAIERYEELLRTAPDSREARDAQTQLATLRKAR